MRLSLHRQIFPAKELRSLGKPVPNWPCCGTLHAAGPEPPDCTGLGIFPSSYSQGEQSTEEKEQWHQNWSRLSPTSGKNMHTGFQSELRGRACSSTSPCCFIRELGDRSILESCVPKAGTCWWWEQPDKLLRSSCSCQPLPETSINQWQPSGQGRELESTGAFRLFSAAQNITTSPSSASALEEMQLSTLHKNHFPSKGAPQLWKGLVMGTSL